MHRFCRRAHTTRHEAFSDLDLLWLLFFLALAAAILLPSLSRARELAKRAVCRANLRGIGLGQHIYANDNYEWFPHHYFEPDKEMPGRPPRHGVSWVGSMGSNESLLITESTSPEKSPQRSHPSRSLFVLVVKNQTVPTQFVCPSSGDRPDGLRNYSAEGDDPALPGISRFDFSGYTSLSYGYQLPYGRHAKPREWLDTRMAITAGKGPYYEAGGPGLPGTRTVKDRRSRINVPADWAGDDAETIEERPQRVWRPYNSRNHRGAGQNVLYVDGHVEFNTTPLVGVNGDNIYTLQSSRSDERGALIGLVPDADQPLGPMTDTDSFIVP